MAKYFNVILTGLAGECEKCSRVYAMLEKRNIKVLSHCGNDESGACIKRIRYTGSGGIRLVRAYFAAALFSQGQDLNYTVNSKRRGSVD